MDITKNSPHHAAASIQHSGNALAGFKPVALPGLALLGLLVAPLAGWQIPGEILAYSIHSLASLAAAVLLLVTAPFIWRSGFRNADSQVSEQSSVTTQELNKQLQSARYQQQRRSKDLDTALAKLKASETRMNTLTGQARRHLAIADTVINASDEAIVLTDVHGVIRGMSAPASQLCGVHRNDALSAAFDAIVQLFDPTAERPANHPVKRIALRAVDAVNAAPHLENCLLTDRMGNSLPVLVSSVAMTDAEGTAIGAYIRLQREDKNSTSQRIPSQVDATTGLTTRDGFIRRLDGLLSDARLTNGQHQLLLIAADNLDFVSDRHGYQAAEQMLWQIGEMCRLASDTEGQCYAVSAGRIGILMEESDSVQAEALADGIRQKLQQTTMTWKNEHIDLPVTIAPLALDASSPGVSRVVDMAESLLRAGRRAGGNRVYKGMPQQASDDQRFDDRGWVDWLQQRLGSGLGHLLSQEILPTNPDELPCVECYMRVEDTDGVWIAPNSFLPALRRAGETAMMDLWVLDQILQQLDEDPSLYERYASIAMNVAAESLQDNVFSLRVSERLSRNRAMAQYIRFEIMENTATSLARETSQFVTAVQQLGASVAIDQARGLGLQQLLQSCAPDAVKLEPALVRASQSDDLAVAQLRWLTDSAHLRKVKVVACGVEDAQWQKKLVQQGVDYVQGSALNKIGPLVV